MSVANTHWRPVPFSHLFAILRWLTEAPLPEARVNGAWPARWRTGRVVTDLPSNLAPITGPQPGNDR
ncbi:hypothetical protein [Amycolatopsis alba]|uniref:Uncharacterized protein n=1 Tax=Amycolatopsis alba DSM 44262 TaxID=1125972 RepID=A0A229RSX3_AMYAL|nr:hypothetical protein [Amycolatopsis alba]OXM49746.1 hypothetical protein CFP75_18435 [Amycolatopsis alba DSM 44262]